MMQMQDGAQPADATVFSNMSGNWGRGTVWEDQWLQLKWAANCHQNCPIVAVCAIRENSGRISVRYVFVCSNNMAVVQVIMTTITSKGSCICSSACNHPSLHNPGSLNTIADSMSCSYAGGTERATNTAAPGLKPTRWHRSRLWHSVW